jgi:hypothetical protein
MTISKKADFYFFRAFLWILGIFYNWNRKSTICNENDGVYVKQYGGKYVCIYNVQAGEDK